MDGGWVASIERRYGESVQDKGTEEMQVILGGSGLTERGIYVSFSLLLDERNECEEIDGDWNLE